MIKRLEIEYLRGIREGVLDDLTPLVILVGPNGCGKSTVLDALLIGSCPNASGFGFAVTRRRGIHDGAQWIAWRGDRHGHPPTVKVFDSDGGQGMRRLRFGNAGPGELEVIRYAVYWSDGEGEGAPVKGDVHFTGGREFQEDFPGFASPVHAVRLVDAYGPEASPPLDELWTEVLKRGQTARVEEMLASLIPGFKRIQTGSERASADLNAPRRALVFFEYADHAVPAALAGDGAQTLLRQTLELAAYPDGLILIEEPECHEHPGAIYQTARVILAATRLDAQIVLTTHSIELIDALLAEATKDDLEQMSLYRLKLADGELIHSRYSGPDVAFARGQIQDDLR